MGEYFAPEEAEEIAKKKAEEIVASEREKIEAEKIELENSRLELEGQLADKERELKGLKDKEFNFSQMRNKVEKKTEAEDKLSKEIEDLRTKIGAIEKQPVEAEKVSFKRAKVGDDKELSEKFDFYYNKLSLGADTPEKREKAMNESLALASGGKNIGGGDGRILATGGGPSFDSKARSNDSKEFQAALGISDADHEKYGKKGNTVKLFNNTR